MRPLRIKGVSIGEGIPKIIVSLMAPDVEGVLADIEKGKQEGVDCFEWRADFSDDVHDPVKIVEQGRQIAAALPTNPLLFTFRSSSQGGELAIPADEYVSLNRAVIRSGFADLVDIESWIGDVAVSDLVEEAKRCGVATVVSYHDFAGTPKVEQMIDLLSHFADLGADIPKVAVMAQSPADALRLMEATEEVARRHVDVPLLTMAMGRAGAITRLTGELFGSALTFCALERASAPGQVDVAQARRIMTELHDVAV